ncbi:hypothetical protein [Streptomyces sp. NPDC008240]|uniref:hypothetical protein n=1 Tax=Streptomyces sp. NPDC008240 TaxID=3364822 RepID=UPI0036F07A7C
MTSLNDLILQQTIQSRVGEPGKVVRIGRTTVSPLAEFRSLAEQVGGQPVELVTVTNGIPGHFGLRGRDSHTVVFHLRQVEICAFLYGLTVETRLEESLLEDAFEGAVLRLIAEFLLQRGHGDQGIATLARSRVVQGGLFLSGPPLGYLESMKRDERYLIEWFFALGHEIGHHLAPELAATLNGLDCFEEGFIRQVVDVVLDGGFDTAAAYRLREIIECGDTGAAGRSHASTQVLREEAVADLFAVVCMSEAWNKLCADQAGRAYSPQVLLLEAMVSMSSVMTIEQCRIMAGWFSDMSYEVENQPLMLSGVALQTRMNLMHIALRDREVHALLAARYPSFAPMTQLDVAAFDTAMRNLAARSLSLSRPFARAREFLSAPEMRDPGVVRAYLEDVAADPTTANDATDFLRVAGHLRSPMLDTLRDVVDGGEPPLIYATGPSG